MSRTSIPFRPQNAQDWELYKEAITGFYHTMELRGPQGVMQTMEHQYNFKATENQYKKQFVKWGVDTKRIKAVEYGAIVRKKRQRELEGKESDIQLRGERVSLKKIARFEKRRNITEQDPLHNAGRRRGSVSSKILRLKEIATPPNLVLRTPSPKIRQDVNPTDFLDSITSVLSESEVPYEFDLLRRSHYDERLTLTSISEILRATPTPALTEIRPQDWLYFSSAKNYSFGQVSKSPSMADPIVATLRLAAYRIPKYEDEVRFQNTFSTLEVEHNCFSCKVVTFMEHLTKQFMVEAIDGEGFKASAGCLIQYTIKAGRGRPGFLPGMSLNLGRYYAALEQLQDCEATPVPGSPGLDDEDAPMIQHVSGDVTQYPHAFRKVGYDALLLKDLFGQAYDGVLWTWHRATTLEGFCCRCREALITLQTGFQERIHKCPGCSHAPSFEDSETFLQQRYEFSEFRELIRQRWAIYLVFLFLGWSERGATVDVDKPNSDEICEQRFVACKIPCAGSSSMCRWKCSRRSLEQWVI